MIEEEQLEEFENRSEKCASQVNMIAFLNKIFESQAQEQEIKHQQLLLEKDQVQAETKRDDNSFKFGMASLEVQLNDRKHNRECDRSQKRDTYILITILSLSVCALIVVAMFLNKDEVAKDLIKAIIYLIAGATAGYGYAIKKISKNDARDESTRQYSEDS